MFRRWFLPCWVVGAAASFALPVVPHWLFWLAAFAVFAVFARRFAFAGLMLCVLAGAAYGVFRTEAALSSQWRAEAVSGVPLTVEVADMPRSDGRRVQFAAKAVDSGGRTFDLLLSDYKRREWAVGSRWRITARVHPVVGELNLRGLNREAWALSNGIGGAGTVGADRVLLHGGSGWGIAVWRSRISRNWQQADADGGLSDGIGLMRALSVGEQSALRPELWQAFRPLGLTHLVSISGLHVTMVAVMFAWLAKRLLACSPRLPARPRVWVLAAGCAGALFYALLAGFSVPTQRSVLMLAAFAWAWRRGRLSAWATWWQALAAVLLFDPLAVLGVGTWLSFGLVAALIWACSGRLHEGKRQTALRGQWAASVLSLVLLGYLFASLPLVSPLVNAVAIPWFSWVLTPLALLGSVVPFAPLQQLGAFLAEYTLRFLVWLADVSPEFAVASAPLPLLVLAVCAALLLLLPRGLGLRPWAVLLLAGFVFYRSPGVPENEVAVTVWDAGQGLSVSVQTANHHLLFDTGTAAAAQMGIVPSLNASGIRYLDYLVLSHHDSDHDGGFQAVGKIPNGGIYAGQPEFYEEARHCAEQRWQWDGVDFEFLMPSERKNIDDNGKSCVLRVVAGGAALLVTGDLDTKGEESLVGKYGGNLYSQVLVLGHHGSNTSSSGVFLNAVSPEYAVASSGYANAYKHPTEAVQNRVRAHGIKLLRTDLSGALQFGLGRGGVKAQRLRGYKFYWQKKPFE
ncbi:DNA internalization-related competence protein ComEC/Rec2 [Neisseria meningitidis]|uniref:DNA internalization-related competence protein ComEC/Rec2 n=1 Tax=Neisseria meningitidis TaxID=487 RepID=UPI00129077F1|nr:DNA internalization-related competence protein ComEC/Rec2 [Neisseria meningitidis]MBH2056280.1 DNA internalization-related competence protein ComEC/Rec2 [Neisseria meningitidis]MBH2060172.1 DNA internalization-related competence protein ComEC/Rec2 [Neisseria meningitidis]MBH2080502.1 DNA internalization-related competence protein ComEC/Rec2 [Neisseria meningitidis]MBH2162095.1 DNA internalization-related competence protein ComEC/Rec2 [Neisseria meningitidis]MBH2280154.1 DNA internalization-